jgi:RNA polymerase sigma factor (sigma-70 family)
LPEHASSLCGELPDGQHAPPEGASLRDLVARLVARDEEAWRWAWDRYAGMSLGLVRHLIAARRWSALQGAEEDVVSDTFVRLLSGITKFRGESPEQLDAFVRANVVFACLQRLRDLRRWPEPMPPTESAADPVDADVIECERMLKHAIASLPQEQALVVALNLQGYTSLEVAARLGIQRQAVFDRKHRALCALREALGRLRFWDECAAHISDLTLTRGSG